jgi:hypothetical protein
MHAVHAVHAMRLWGAAARSSEINEAARQAVGLATERIWLFRDVGQSAGDSQRRDG